MENLRVKDVLVNVDLIDCNIHNIGDLPVSRLVQ